MLKSCVGFMNVGNGQRPEERIQETRLVRGKEAAHELDSDSNISQPPRRNVPIAKYKQIGGDRGNDPRKDESIIIFDRGEDSGKISERLKLIEQSFLSYVRASQLRLEAELEQNRTLEQDFLAAIRQLEREIDYLSSSESNNHADLDMQKQE